MDKAGFKQTCETEGFKQECETEGFDAVELKQGKAGFTSKMHTHPFSVRVMVLDGEFSITRNGGTEVYGGGEQFAMESGCEHAEGFGANGASYLVARKHDAAAA